MLICWPQYQGHKYEDTPWITHCRHQWHTTENYTQPSKSWSKSGHQVRMFSSRTLIHIPSTVATEWPLTRCLGNSRHWIVTRIVPNNSQWPWHIIQSICRWMESAETTAFQLYQVQYQEPAGICISCCDTKFLQEINGWILCGSEGIGRLVSSTHMPLLSPDSYQVARPAFKKEKHLD